MMTSRAAGEGDVVNPDVVRGPRRRDLPGQTPQLVDVDGGRPRVAPARLLPELGEGDLVAGPLLRQLDGDAEVVEALRAYTGFLGRVDVRNGEADMGRAAGAHLGQEGDALVPGAVVDLGRVAEVDAHAGVGLAGGPQLALDVDGMPGAVRSAVGHGELRLRRVNRAPDLVREGRPVPAALLAHQDLVVAVLAVVDHRLLVAGGCRVVVDRILAELIHGAASHQGDRGEEDCVGPHRRK